MLKTSTSEFLIQPSGGMQAFLLKGGKKLSLEDPQAGAAGEGAQVISGGKELNFVLDLGHAQVIEASGKMGRGKRIEIPASGSSNANLKPAVQVEAYDDFPNLLLSSIQYQNNGSDNIQIDRVVEQQHRPARHLGVDHSAHIRSIHPHTERVGRHDHHPRVIPEMPMGRFPDVRFQSGMIGKSR